MTMTFNDPRLGTNLDTPSLEDRIINLSHELVIAQGDLKNANDKIEMFAPIKDELDQARDKLVTWQKMYSRLSCQIDNVASLIKDAIINDCVDVDVLKNIATELNIALTREVRVTVTVTASGTATVPIDFDLDNIDNEIGVDFTNNYGTDVEFDIEVDDMDVDCEDI